MIVLGGEEGFECEVFVDGIHLEYVSEFKYLGCVLDESGAGEAEFSRKGESVRRVAGGIRSLFNVQSLQLECTKVFHESLLVPVLKYGNETMIWWEDRSTIRAVHMDNFRGMLGIRRMDKVPNTRIRQFCGVTKGGDEKIDEGVLRWFGCVQRD